MSNQVLIFCTGEVYFYKYDDTGRLTDVTLPTGETIELEATVDSKGAKITLSQNSAVAGVATYNGNSLSLSHGKLINPSTSSHNQRGYKADQHLLLLLLLSNTINFTLEVNVIP